MYSAISKYLVSLLQKYNSDLKDEESREIAEYGIEISLSSIVKYVLILLIGMCVHSVFASIMFLITFNSMRKYIGGYHCKTYFRCNLTFCLIFFLVLFFSKISCCYTGVEMLIILLLWCGYGIWFLGPVQNSHKPISIEQKKRCHKIAKFLYIMISILIICLNNLSIYYARIVTFSLVSVVILLPPGKLLERREQYDQEGKNCQSNNCSDC